MRPTLPLVGLALLGAITGPVTAAQAAAAPSPLVPRTPAQARAQAREARAIDLLNGATRHVRRSQKACRPELSAFETQPPLAGAPDPAILAALAPLRRPATLADAPATDRPGGSIATHGPGAVYSGYIRSAVAADGQRMSIVIARQTPPAARPTRCLRAETARLAHELSGQSPDVARIARRILRRIHLEERRQTRLPFDGIFLYALDADGSGGGGGGGDVRNFLQHGNFISSSRHGGSQVSGLVPDGVARVRFTYPKRVTHGRRYKPTSYKRTIRRTVTVHDNVLDFHIARSADAALPSRMVWLAADGTVLRTITR